MVAIGCFAAWTTLLVLAGFGPHSVFYEPSGPGDDLVFWFSPLVAFGAALAWYVVRSRTARLSLVTGAILVVFTWYFVSYAVARLPRADNDGFLWTFAYWQVAVMLLGIVAVCQGAASVVRDSRSRSRVARGSVQAWHPDEGWGVLVSPRVRGDVWASADAVALEEGSGVRELHEGQSVVFSYRRVGDWDGYSFAAEWVRDADMSRRG